MNSTMPQVGDLVLATLPNGTTQQAIITMSLQGLSSAWRVRNARGESYCANFTPIKAPFSLISAKDAIVNASLLEAAIEDSSDDLWRLAEEGDAVGDWNARTNYPALCDF